MTSSIISQSSLGPATETQSGLVTTSTQNIAGDKTFINSITVNGPLTTPNRPAFLLGWPGNMSLTPTAVVPPLGGAIRYNIGNYFNTSTMRFTCPYTGLYMIGLSFLRNNNAIVCRGNVFKNGIELGQQLRTTEGYAGYNHSAGQWTVVSAIANDYIEVRISADSATTLYSDSGNLGYNWICGYFIG